MARIPVAQRRRQLVEAAVEVIATHGIDGATTRRIADQAKANVAMVHYCYDSKEDLFADVYEFVGGRFRHVIEESDPHSTVLETAQGILRGVMECYYETPSFGARCQALNSMPPSMAWPCVSSAFIVSPSSSTRAPCGSRISATQASCPSSEKLSSAKR